MAYANQNQGVFVPYHQLIDPRSLNQPVTFVTGPPIALNFINPSSGTVLVPPNPTLVPSFGFALDPAFLVRIEEARSRSLLQFMADEGLVPSPEEEIRRKNAIEKLKQIVMEWIKSVAHKRQLHRQHTTDASATVLTYGSYGLGVHNSESDIDALCVGPCFATLAEDFFVVLHSMLTSRPEVSEVHCVKDAKVPLMRFKLDGISIDLPYAQLKVMSVPENVDILNPFFLSNIDETSWRSLSGVHANKCILRLLPNMEVSSMLSMGSYASDQDELGKWVGWVKSQFCSLLVKLEELQSFCDPNPTEYVDVNVTEPNIVFYWGLGRNGFLDLRSVKEYFVQSIRAGYQGRTGTMKLSVVQASQLPKNAQFDN